MCDGLMMRLCTLTELANGECCGRGCALEDARVWSADECTMPSEHTPIEALPLRAERVRVSINGQQYAPGFPRRMVLGASGPLQGGFTYYDLAQLHLSAITPSGGPLAGGTLVTLIGVGLVDLGVRVSFAATAAAAPNASLRLVKAQAVYGAMRGRVLTCVTPASPTGEAGAANVEVTLNGETLPSAITSGGALRFTYAAPIDTYSAPIDGTVASGASDDLGSGGGSDGESGESGSGSGEIGSGSGESGSGP